MLYGLSAEQDMIAQTVRSFVEKEIYPHEELVERTVGPARTTIFQSKTRWPEKSLAARSGSRTLARQ